MSLVSIRIPPEPAKPSIMGFANLIGRHPNDNDSLQSETLGGSQCQEVFGCRCNGQTADKVPRPGNWRHMEQWLTELDKSQVASSVPGRKGTQRAMGRLTSRSLEAHTLPPAMTFS